EASPQTAESGPADRRIFVTNGEEGTLIPFSACGQPRLVACGSASVRGGDATPARLPRWGPRVGPHRQLKKETRHARTRRSPSVSAFPSSTRHRSESDGANEHRTYQGAWVESRHAHCFRHPAVARLLSGSVRDADPGPA